MIGIIDLSSSSGGSKINGIVEEYMAGGNITTGGFVKLVNELNIGENTQLSSSTNSGTTNINIVKLTENKVYVIYNGDYSNSKYKLHGMLCTINETDITIVSDTVLDSRYNYEHTISAVALDENRVFISYIREDSSNKYLYGLIVSINGTIGTITQLYDTSLMYRTLSAMLINDNKVFIILGDKIRNYMYNFRQYDNS